MKLSDATDYFERVVDTRSRIDKQDIVWEALQEAESDEEADVLLAMTTCQRFEDNGVSKQTIRNVLDMPSSEYAESTHGDFPSTVEAFYDDQPPREREDMKLHVLLERLEQVEEQGGREMESTIEYMLSSYEEPKWVAHALLADDGVSMGFGVKSAAKMIRRNYDAITKEDMARARALTPDILQLYKDAPDIRLSPEVGEPFKPMLASSEDLPEIPEMEDLEDGEIPGSERGKWLIQPKFDGARILVHYDGPEGIIRAFSRNCNEVTDSLPELQALTDDFDDDARFILDGEAVAYEAGEPQDFQHIMTRFNRKHDVDEQAIDVRFHFFDCVYAEGDRFTGEADRTTQSHQNRMNTLETIFDTLSWYEEGENQISDDLDPRDTRVAQTNRVYSTDGMMARYQQYVDHGYEGAIVKRDDAEYEFDKRSSSWRKVKAYRENIDLRVTEVIEGEDARAGVMGALRLETEEGYNLGKVGTGFTDEDLEYIWEHRDEVEGSIVEVEWQELVEEDGQYSLRFPAFVALRDKDHADSIDKIESL